jgi:purine-binding chemotaxis protein CheW
MDDSDDPFDGDDEDNSASMFLTFRVGSAEYALPVLMVTEIVRLPTWHPLPDVPPHICGVVNLRSRVVPIMDLRMRFGLGVHKATERTVVVVVEIEGVATGLLVDGVSDVAELAEIEEGTVRAGVGRSELLRGVAKKGERVVFVLDAAALLAPVAATVAAASVPA